MLRSSKAAMDDELKQVSQRPRGEMETTESQSSTSGSKNPSSATSTFLPHSITVASNKAYATLKGSKKFSQDSNQPRKPEPPTRDLSSASVAAISATPLTHVVMAQGPFPQGHVHLTSADLLVHPQPTTHRDSNAIPTVAVAGGGGSRCIKSSVGGGGATSAILQPVSLNNANSAGGIVEATEEWVLHTSCQGESNELLRECCLQSESRSDDSYPVHLSPSRNETTENYHLCQPQGHLLQNSGIGASSLVGSSRNPNSSSMMFNIMKDPPTLSSPINPSHIAKAICPPPPSDSELGSLSHHPWSNESHHPPSQVC